MLDAQSRASASEDVQGVDELSLGWEGCKKSAMASMATATPFRIATILHCCNKGNFVDDELITSTLQKALKDAEKGLKFAPIGVSLSIQSLGCMARHVRLSYPGKDYQFEPLARMFTVSLLKYCEQRKAFQHAAFNPRNLSAVMHGLGLLCHVPSIGALDPCLAPVADKILEEFIVKIGKTPFSDKDISCILHGCANLQLTQEEYIFRVGELLRVSLARNRAFGSHGLANIVWALGKLNYRNDDILMRLGTEVVKDSLLYKHTSQALANFVYSFGILEFSNAEIMRKLFGQVAQKSMLSKYKDQELWSIVYGLGKMGCTDMKVMEIFGAEICRESRLPHISTQGLANILYAFGKANYFDPSLCTTLLERCQPQMELFTPQELTCTVYGLAHVHDKAFASFRYDCVLRHVENVAMEWKSRAASFPTLCIANMSWALSELRYYDAEWMEMMLNAYLNQTTVVFQELGMIMVSIARQNHKNATFLHFSRNYFKLEVDNMPNIQIICNFIWAFAILGILDTSMFLRACARIDQLQAAGASVRFQEWRQLLQGWMYLSIVKKKQVGLKGATRVLVDKAKAQSREMNATQGASKAEIMVSEFLTLEGIPHKPGAAVVDGLIIVDLLLTGTHPQFVVECDGPWHFSYNQQDGKFFPQGVTVLRNKILEASGFKVSMAFFLQLP